MRQVGVVKGAEAISVVTRYDKYPDSIKSLKDRELRPHVSLSRWQTRSLRLRTVTEGFCVASTLVLRRLRHDCLLPYT